MTRHPLSPDAGRRADVPVQGFGKMFVQDLLHGLPRETGIGAKEVVHLLREAPFDAQIPQLRDVQVSARILRKLRIPRNVPQSIGEQPAKRIVGTNASAR